MQSPMTETIEPKRKRGRPRKTEVEAKKRGNRGVVGRPPGDAARINEFKARLLATSGDKVINKIIHIALNDEHPGQMAALKIVWIEYYRCLTLKRIKCLKVRVL